MQAQSRTSRLSSASSPVDLEERGYPFLRRHLRLKWKKAKGQTSLYAAHSFLTSQYDLLTVLTSSIDRTSIDETEAGLKQKYTSADAHAAIRANKPRPKAKLVGGYIYPSVNLPPMPRLKPQPPHVDGMIRSRIASRQRKCPACGVGFAKEDVQTLFWQ